MLSAAPYPVPKQTAPRRGLASAGRILSLWMGLFPLLGKDRTVLHQESRDLRPGGGSARSKHVAAHSVDQALRHSPLHGGQGFAADIICIGIVAEISSGGDVCAAIGCKVVHHGDHGLAADVAGGIKGVCANVSGNLVLRTSCDRVCVPGAVLGVCIHRIAHGGIVCQVVQDGDKAAPGGIRQWVEVLLVHADHQLMTGGKEHAVV